MIRNLSLFVTIIIFSFFSSYLAKAETMENINQLYSSANKEYKSANYLKAEEEYEKIINSGINNGYVFFNLGNTYFKLNQNGQALANYLKAQDLLPRENKVNKNLNQLYEKINYEPSSFDKVSGLFKFFSLKETIILFLGIWFLIFLLFLIKKSNNLKVLKNLNKVNGLMTFLFIFFLYFSTSLAFRLFVSSENKAVVVVQESDVKVSNNISDITLFKVKESQIINIIDEQGDWAKINLDDKKGWINKSSIEKISEF